MKTEKQLKDLCTFFESFEQRMIASGRLLVARYARGQYQKYNRLLLVKWETA